MGNKGRDIIYNMKNMILLEENMEEIGSNYKRYEKEYHYYKNGGADVGNYKNDKCIVVCAKLNNDALSQYFSFLN